MGIRAGVMRVYQSLFWRQKNKNNVPPLTNGVQPFSDIDKTGYKKRKTLTYGTYGHCTQILSL